MIKKTSFGLAYNFIKIKELGNIYVPVPFVATVVDGQLNYYYKKATPDVLANRNLTEEGSFHLKLIQLCETLSLRSLEEKHLRKQVRKISFADYLKDKAILQVVLKYVNLQKRAFFQLVFEEKAAIYYFDDKASFLPKAFISCNGATITPVLHFKRTEEGVFYTLKLKLKKRELIPSKNVIHILFDADGYFSMNGELYELKYINAKKLLPFLQKEQVFVPKRTELLYFKKFVLGVSNKLTLETEGFTVREFTEVTDCKLTVIHNFLRDEFALRLRFFYQNECFYQDETQRVKTTIAVENQDLKLNKTIRNYKQEQHFVSALEKEEFLQNNQGYFVMKASKDPYELVSKLIKIKTTLEGYGFTIAPIEIGGKKLSLHATVLDISVTEKLDWFDINAVVEHGDHRIKFIDLKQHIIAGNRFFELAGGDFFIIPLEWMAQYKPVFLLGRIVDNVLKLAKSQYPVLEFLDLEHTNQRKDNTMQIEIPDTFKATLRSYQKEGVSWLMEHHANKLGACLADDMGLGKTIQTIAVLCYAKQEIGRSNPTEQAVLPLDLFSHTSIERTTPLCALLVLPASLVFNWKNEFKKFAPSLKVIAYRGAARKKIKSRIKNYDVILTTYQTALRDIEHFHTLPLSYLILDESQYIKNNNSKVFKAINSLKPSHKISLSGTPIENSLSDLWSQMEFINNGVLGSYPSFKKHYQTPIENTRNEVLIASLKKLVAPYILRRTKKEVLKELPALNSQVFYVAMDPQQEKLYDKEKSLVRNQLLNIANKNKLEVLKQILRLRQLSNHPVLLSNEHVLLSSGKFKYVTTYLKTLIQANQKILVFSSFVSHLRLYEDWASQEGIRFCTLTGSTKSSKREAVVQEFQENKDVSLFFVSLKAGGTGLNLTAASYVVILDPWWNPFAEEQAIARAHRMGQEQKVNVARFVSKDTLEEKILELQERKRNLSGTFLDDFGSNDLSLSEVMELI